MSATSTNNGHKFQSGISMVEILVALVISVFLLGGIVQVYLGNKTTFKFANAISEVQENGRFSLDIISQDIRQLDDWGCIGFDPDRIETHLRALTVAGYDPVLHDFEDNDAIEGTNDTGLNNSDTITIRGSKPGQINVVGPFATAGQNFIETTTTNTITNNDILLIMRCGENNINSDADIIRVTGVGVGTNSPNNRRILHNGNMALMYKNDGSVRELQTVTYSVQNGASGQPALFRAEFGVVQELIEGVEEMQILYGVDTDSDDVPNRYDNSNIVANFDNVVSVRVMLLVRSIDDFVTEAPQVFTFNGDQRVAPDRRLRQVFSTTIALRNRIGEI